MRGKLLTIVFILSLLAALACFIASFFLIRRLHWNPIATMVFSGGVYTAAHLIFNI